jgi:hypothetical protein
MQKDAYYFKHDSNARHDPKIRSMMKKYGAAGYGWYWILIENLREATGYRLKSDPITLDCLADDMRCSVKDAQDFIDYLCSNDLKLLTKTENDGGPPHFYSMSLMLRMNHLDSIREKRAKAGSWIRD